MIVFVLTFSKAATSKILSSAGLVQSMVNEWALESKRGYMGEQEFKREIQRRTQLGVYSHLLGSGGGGSGFRLNGREVSGGGQVGVSSPGVGLLSGERCAFRWVRVLTMIAD